MNPLILWLPGTVLLLVGIALIFTKAVALPIAVGIGVFGGIVESLGILLWVRQRSGSGR